MTRGLTILVLSAAATAALCGAGRAADGPAVRTAYARGDDWPSNAAADAIDPGARRDDGDDSGNPLWAVPLSVLTETRDRPLFSLSRRPPASDPPPAPPPPPAQAPAIAAQPAPEKPPWALVGTIVSPAGSLAIVQNIGTQAVSRVRLGEEDSGWRVRSVAARSIVVQKGEATVTLELPRISTTETQP